MYGILKTMQLTSFSSTARNDPGGRKWDIITKKGKPTALTLTRWFPERAY